jgi:glycosyltransferase involved in cell wall biosynthesis
VRFNRATTETGRAAVGSFPRPAEAHAQAFARGAAPRVSIGLPVYNGAQYLPAAVEALLAQTFTDFELILCDNASTDQTQAICTAFAARDSRVRYHRNDENIGAAPNFNLVFHLSRGEYFKWAAHDDLHAPDYLARCVEALDNEPAAVLAHTGAVVVDSDGEPVPVREYDSPPGQRDADAPMYLREHLYDLDRQVDSPDPAVRLSEILTRTKWCFEIFGVMRASALRRTPLHLKFYGSDKVLLASLALQGPFRELPERLFVRRHHPGQSSSKDGRAQALFMSSRGRTQYVPPQLRCLQWYVRLIARSGLPLRDRLHCLGATGRWVVWLMRLIVSQRKERGFLHRMVSKFGGT